MAERTSTAKLPDSDLLALPVEAREGVKLLIVQDDPGLRERLTTTMRLDGYTATAVASGTEALAALKRGAYDIVLTDLDMTPVGGLEVLCAAREARRDAIVIVVTANPSIAASIEVLRAGAWDYLATPFLATHLQVLIGRAAHCVLQTRAVRALRAEVERLAEHRAPVALIGTSRAMRDAVELARKVAMTDASVFLVGESGTGKQQFAHFIHENSRRAAKPFMALDCGAMPEPLLQSELFGRRNGAFTGAERDKQGLLESGHTGTLFLDALSEMPLTVQSTLLGVLQDGVLHHAGSERPDSVVDVRFISAMNGDPEEAVSTGRLLEDLLHRFRVFSIRLPSLRERREDIPLLATHFLANAWIRHRVAGTAMPKLTARSLDLLGAQPWRGNVRELRDMIEHVAVLADAGQQIDPEHIPLGQHAGADAVDVSGALSSEVLREPFRAAKERCVAEFERMYLRRLVDISGGNLARAARIAHVDRKTLYRLIEKHNIGVRREVLAEARERSAAATSFSQAE
jgi:DNA-binding NtrC family response regulator